jgi:hypothetical protein
VTEVSAQQTRPNFADRDKSSYRKRPSGWEKALASVGEGLVAKGGDGGLGREEEEQSRAKNSSEPAQVSRPIFAENRIFDF